MCSRALSSGVLRAAPGGSVGDGLAGGRPFWCAPAGPAVTDFSGAVLGACLGSGAGAGATLRLPAPRAGLAAGLSEAGGTVEAESGLVDEVALPEASALGAGAGSGLALASGFAGPGLVASGLAGSGLAGSGLAGSGLLGTAGFAAGAFLSDLGGPALAPGATGRLPGLA